MLRSMFAAVSGLRSHQTMMDVVGNNIANVNTAGYKSSRATFQDAISQVIRGSSAVSNARAGTNPMQVGLGAQLGSIDGVFTQGSIQLTGRSTDLAIQGDGFFVMELNDQTLYSRAGAFSVDSAGGLTGPSGARIMGWMPMADGTIDTQQPLEAITLPTGQVIEPVATSAVTIGGNLPATGLAATPTVVTSSITIYDSLGAAHQLNFEWTKTNDATQEWTLDVTSPDNVAGAAVSLGGGTMTFDTDGTLLTPAGGSITLTAADFGAGTPQDIDLNFAEPGVEIVQYGDTITAEARLQDGSEMGFLRGFEFGVDGSITGRFSNGLAKPLGMVALATFNNSAGLQRQGENIFASTLNSGVALVSQPGAGDAGVLTPGALEMSNVELANEFTNLIIAQRGFQANARAITASDEMLADMVNMKR